jgi:hypothetical protein
VHVLLTGGVRRLSWAFSLHLPGVWIRSQRTLPTVRRGEASHEKLHQFKKWIYDIYWGIGKGSLGDYTIEPHMYAPLHHD